MKIEIIILLIICLVSVDKIITGANIIQYGKNFSEEKRLEVEKNPMAKYFFEKLGLFFGSVLYGVVSFILAMIGFLVISYFFGDSKALWVIFLIYGLVIINNIFFLLKFSKVI